MQRVLMEQPRPLEVGLATGRYRSSRDRRALRTEPLVDNLRPRKYPSIKQNSHMRATNVGEDKDSLKRQRAREEKDQLDALGGDVVVEIVGKRVTKICHGPSGAHWRTERERSHPSLTRWDDTNGSMVQMNYTRLYSLEKADAMKISLNSRRLAPCALIGAPLASSCRTAYFPIRLK